MQVDRLWTSASQVFFNEYLVTFLIACRLIDFVLLPLKLLIFEVCGIIGISKIEFFKFFGTERVKQNLENK